MRANRSTPQNGPVLLWVGEGIFGDRARGEGFGGLTLNPRP